MPCTQVTCLPLPLCEKTLCTQSACSLGKLFPTPEHNYTQNVVMLTQQTLMRTGSQEVGFGDRLGLGFAA